MRGVDKNIGSCPTCHQVVSFSSGDKRDEVAYCPRCGSEVHLRKSDSLEITLALLLTSIIFYIPANLFPMMHVHTFAGTQSDTILSGVIYFIESGSYFIGIVIFIASVLVPVAKIIILLYLVYSVKVKKPTAKKSRQKLYLLTELVGRWSMVDVYVVSIMIALVHFGGLTQIEAGLGALFFLLVVIATMLAAMSFDSRLIWDNSKEYYV